MQCSGWRGNFSNFVRAVWRAAAAPIRRSCQPILHAFDGASRQSATMLVAFVAPPVVAIFGNVRSALAARGSSCLATESRRAHAVLDGVDRTHHIAGMSLPCLTVAS